MDLSAFVSRAITECITYLFRHFGIMWKSSTLDSHDMPSSFNHSERKTQYRLVRLTFFFGGVCTNVSLTLHSELQSLCSTNSVCKDDMGLKIL